MICESEHFILHHDPEVPIRGFLILRAGKPLPPL
jgi:hypothetical protein